MAEARLLRLRRLGARLRRRGLGEAGSATIEFVVWMPFWALLLISMGDISLQLAHRANVESAALDTVYAMSRHQITAAEAESHLRDMIEVGNPDSVNVLASLGENATVTVTRSEDRVFRFSLFGWAITFLPDGYLTRVTMLAEPA